MWRSRYVVALALALSLCGGLAWAEEVDLSAGEGDFVAKYTGHVAGNLMGGEVDMGEHGKTTWKATKN
jgi:hypothetical protein